MKRRLATAGVLAFPLVLFLGWMAYHAAVASWGQEVELAVVGYDPRDLLSGHYVQYRVDYGIEPCGGGEGDVAEPRCLCFERLGSFPPVSWYGHCGDKPATCRNMLRGQCVGGRLEAGIERYYFPEEHRDLLARLPEGSSIKVRLDGSGGGQVVGLYVDGVAVERWVEQ